MHLPQDQFASLENKESKLEEMCICKRMDGVDNEKCVLPESEGRGRINKSQAAPRRRTVGDMRGRIAPKGSFIEEITQYHYRTIY